MEPNQIQLIIGILFILAIVSFFFKVTRKLAVWAILSVFFLGLGFIGGVVISKDHIKKNNPVCYEVIYNKK